MNNKHKVNLMIRVKNLVLLDMTTTQEATSYIIQILEKQSLIKISYLMRKENEIGDHVMKNFFLYFEEENMVKSKMKQAREQRTAPPIISTISTLENSHSTSSDNSSERTPRLKSINDLYVKNYESR